jgi:hypothetical protein
MRHEAYPFSRLTDLIIINRPLLTNFNLLRARFFGLHALYTPLFNFNFAQLCFSRVLYFASFSACLVTFSRASSFARNRTFSCLPEFFFIASRAFPFRVIAYCSFLSTAVRCRWRFTFFNASPVTPWCRPVCDSRQVVFINLPKKALLSVHGAWR